MQGFYFDLYNHIPHAFRYYQSVCIEFMTYVGKNSNCMPGQITKKFVKARNVCIITEYRRKYKN